VTKAAAANCGHKSGNNQLVSAIKQQFAVTKAQQFTSGDKNSTQLQHSNDSIT